jgi:hypothetical protein
VTGDPTASAPTVASCGSRAGQARSPRGAAKCEECVGVVSSSGERAEQRLQQWRHSCMGAAMAAMAMCGQVSTGRDREMRRGRGGDGELGLSLS